MDYKKLFIHDNDASDADKSLCEQLITQREANFSHAPFDKELAFYESICSGNIELVKVLASPLCSEGYGVLSKNPLTNLKYHLVVSVAMITRYCINSGMSPEQAYSMSDMYILKGDECKTEKEIHAVHSEMLVGFTKRMREIKNGRIYSKPIVKAMDYISENLHNRIMIQDVAEYLKLSVSYLSRLFKSEVNIAFSEYVNIKKIEEAASMLRFTEYSDIEISNILDFSSQSYFIKVFKKYKGMTPRVYKNNYHFLNEDNQKNENTTE